MKQGIWLQDFHDGRDQAENIVSLLHEKANHLRAVGMNGLAEELDWFAYEINQGVAKMDAAVTGNITNEFNLSCREIANTLHTLISVTTENKE